MNLSPYAVAIVALAALTVIGDGFLKVASLKPHALHNWWFAAGCLVYALSAFGWVFVMRHVKLTSIGVVFALSTVLLLAALGVWGFGERLNRFEMAGIVLGVAAIVLLGRFGS